VLLPIPAGTDPALAGLVAQHAFVVFDLAPLEILHVSNPVAVDLIP
jgi:hypothetical protein